MKNRRPLRTEAEQFAGVRRIKPSPGVVTDRYMMQEPGSGRVWFVAKFTYLPSFP